MDLTKAPQWRVQGVDAELSGERFGRRRQTPQAPVQRRPILEEVTSQRKYPLEIVKQFFGPESSGAKAQRLRNEDPVAYAEMHRDAEHYNLIAAPGYFDPQRDAFTPERRVFSEDELRARQEFSEAEIKRLYKSDPKSPDYNPNDNNLAKIAKEDPEKYQRIRTAAVSYGYVSAESGVVVRPQPKPQPKSDESFVLSQEFADKFRVPSGTRMTHQEFDNATNVYLEHQEAQRKAAQEAAAENQGQKQ